MAQTAKKSRRKVILRLVMTMTTTSEMSGKTMPLGLMTQMVMKRREMSKTRILLTWTS